MKANQILREGAYTYEQRNEMYGDNYKSFGLFMELLFPDGIPDMAVNDWNRFGLIVQCVSKLTRYCHQFNQGGHADSAHDLMVYAAMLEELTKE